MPKTLYNSSTPIKPKFDPVSKNSSTTINSTMNYEKIFPGIYLTSIKDLCSPDDLKIYGFTHIIYIDKHIMQNGIPNITDSDSQHNVYNANSRNDYENVIKNAETSVTASITIRYTNQSASNSVSCIRSSSSSSSSNNFSSTSSSMMDHSLRPSKSTAMTTDRTACSMSYNHEMPIDDETIPMKPYDINENLFEHSDFETLELNFGESSHFTANVLPNCYKAVAFIENALKNNGAVLVIGCIGENQKCITIVIGFLMYKYNKNFL